jgi:DNA polymerase I
MKNKLILVDGSSYLFRAYYALPPLNNSNGQATGAILGVINMLKKLVNTYSPTWMVVVFDSKEPTFRHNIFKEYKANRSSMPEELAQQIKPLLEIITALGFCVVQIPGYEADDIIGTLVNKAERENGIFSIISTGDKDLTQLVNDNTIIVNTMNDTILDRPGVIDKFKVPPELITDYLVLTGDQVDNIPGVTNVGPKTAIKWLEQYKNLDGIVKYSSDITGKVGENLRAAISNFDLYKKLVTIDTNLDLDLNISDLIIKPKDVTKLQFWFTELEFNSWLKELNINLDSNLNINININNNINNLLKNLEDTKVFSIYLHSASAISVAILDSDIYYYIEDINIDLLQKLASFLIDNKKTKIFYDIKQTAKILEEYNIVINPPFFDVSLESYVLNSLNKLKLDQTDQMIAKFILDTHNNLYSIINESIQLKNILMNIELPLAMVLKKMEGYGVLVDSSKLASQGIEIQKKLVDLENLAYSLSGENFNLNSPKQLQEIFYNKLKLPILKKTPKGQASTSEDVLQELAVEFELPKIILEYRTLSKLQSTYIDKLPKSINAKTGRIHTSYHQTVTATGRLSSSDPNLQNIPIRTKEGRSIREAFIARPGYKILSADYSQIELRILAHLSNDPGLIRGFADNLDIHAITASEVFHVPIENVTEDLRRKAKAINFGLIYGMSDFGLAKQLKISRKEANLYMTIYFSKFNKVLEFMENTRKIAAKNGFVETMFGRRLYLPDINSKNMMLRKAAERAAINAPMQGAQADLIKMAMINLDQWIEQNAKDIFMLMQVHDELIFEVPNDKLNFAKENIANIMNKVANLSVNFKVEIGIGDNWAAAH